MEKSVEKLLCEINWEMSGPEIEAESFRRIEEGLTGWRRQVPDEIFKIGRRLVHTTADFSLVNDLVWHNDPVAAGLSALKEHAPIYCDATMIRSGLSEARLKSVNPDYSKDDICCLVADPEVAAAAARRGQARSLVALEKAEAVIDGGIVLIGNAPLALAGIIRLHAEKGIRPRLVIGLPVGFVHVVESKELLMATDIPHLVIRGRRGGSSLAVATLHAIIESFAG
jgi:precorrin isomerase